MQDYNLMLVTQPTVEPLLIVDVKPYLRLDTLTDTTDDLYITSLISVAREYCEVYQHRAYITQTWEMSFGRFPRDGRDTVNNSVENDKIEIPKGRLQAINSFTYQDSAGVITTMQPNIDYVVSTRGMLGRVCPPFGKVFPVALLYPLDPIVIRFTCGYGDDGLKVPFVIKQAMLLLVSHWYDNRMVINDLRGVNPEEVSFAVTALLTKDKIINV